MFTSRTPKRITRRSTLLATLCMSVALLLATLVPQNVERAFARPLFRMPFRCGQVWIASTRSNHSPVYAVDFNRDNDYGDAVLASAGGTVSVVRNLGDTSYGRYIIINHGGGWSTLYAHLSDFNVSVGQSVSMGTLIGHVGDSGGVTGPHLHYEQRLDGNDVRAILGSYNVVYFDEYQQLTSHNGC
jgi:hypothetical protein